MLINFLNRYNKTAAWFLFLSFYLNLIAPSLSFAIEKIPYHRIADVGAVKIDHTEKYFDLGRSFPKITISHAPALISPLYTNNKKIVERSFIGPTQPEMQQFQSVNSNNMVDLFSGDFSYNIPLLDVGGYPINLSYRSGISMDQEASWVGLGWNVNPGAITRNLRGLPDDFNGSDSVKKVMSVKENKTIGVTGGADVEIAGLPVTPKIGISSGVFYNNYKGWGLENSLSVSINSGRGAQGPLTAGLSVTNNTQDGVTIQPSLDIKVKQDEADNNGGFIGNFGISAPYNSRSGLKGLQLSAGLTQFKNSTADQKHSSHSISGDAIEPFISFVSPTGPPQITMPYTSTQYTFTARVGFSDIVLSPAFFVKGYVSKQFVAKADTLLALPAYGYLYYQNGAKNETALMDFNREKELVYRDYPPIPHIAVPFYTYDAFSITGEGTGGMFRAYRGDIGFMFDHFIRTKDNSARGGADLGFNPNLTHEGIDLNFTRAYTQNSAWIGDNTIRSMVGFKSDSGTFQAAYFRNPGEKSVNSQNFYNSIGGDDVVTASLYQPSPSVSTMTATNILKRYRNNQVVGQDTLNKGNTFRTTREKRSQVITYLNAQEASTSGLSKYIENYALNAFVLNNCPNSVNTYTPGPGSGLIGEYFTKKFFKGYDTTIQNDRISHSWGQVYYQDSPRINNDSWPSPYFTHQTNNQYFSAQWTGQIKAPVTGPYTITLWSDDGVLLWLNDSLIVSNNTGHPLGNGENSFKVNLVKGEFYKIKLNYFQDQGPAIVQLWWSYPGRSMIVIPDSSLYNPAVDSFLINNGNLVLEKRVNDFRKSNHISEIDVLNTDGRRYVYGIPVYNLKQKEATFSVNATRGNNSTGLVGFNPGIDNTTANPNGQNNYFSSEEMPAYAHSFLLTGVLSPDYVDLTGDGITDDDLGNAIKLNYSKIRGLGNPYKWRIPYVTDSATYNPSLKTDNRDDKGSYVYGEKELWYLHSIESKTMIATFIVQNRNDLFSIDEAGNKHRDSAAKCLKEIDLYNKADLIKNPLTAIPIKVVHFEYDSSLCKGINLPITDSGKLTLRKIWFTYNGNDKGKQNPYVFYYHSNNPPFDVKSYDRWGSYKDPLQNPGSTTAHLINNADYPYSVQDSTIAANNAGAWGLDSIFLPSGGSLKVDYESDDYAYVQNLRAMQMFKVLGLSKDSVYGNAKTQLYDTTADFLYAFASVPTAVINNQDAFQKYLTSVYKIYFKLFVRMPDDQFGSGSEYVSCYATLDTASHHYYGKSSSNVIWMKIKGISLAGDADGKYSPLAKAAIQYLRLNLPSKAYANSEGDNVDLAAAVKAIFSIFGEVAGALKTFDNTARGNHWAMLIDTNRTLVRLDNPIYKKFGGGHRVKRITVYDNWNQMTKVSGSRTAKYGQEYIYTTRQEINGIMTTISSGVASYEPAIGGEENPFHQPIEYIESITPLGPTTLGYSEEPLCESLFPAPGIGYSQVTVRTINYKNIKSANGYEQTKFYTAYDFPTKTERTMLDPDNAKRYKPSIPNFLRINAKYFLALSQGFKIELNDMHGKLRSQAYFAQTDSINPVTYTENFYKVVDQQVDQKVLSNSAMVMHPDGTIDSAATIGKDAELMMDMREQESVTSGANIELNNDMFVVGLPAFFPTLIGLPQHEDIRYRSIATVKVLQRYGILDSVMHTDKGSKVSTKDLLYDSETGDVLVTRTKNEFDDPVYTFNYPSHWAYDGMGLAYKNVDIILQNINIKSGKITGGLSVADSTIFSGGDEILVAGRPKINTRINCTDTIATFPDYNTIWAIDTSVLKPGAKSFFFVDASGIPYSGDSVTLKIIRSGRRNILTSVSSISTLVNPIVQNPSTHVYSLVLDTTSKAIQAAAAEFNQFWKVPDRKAEKVTINCTDSLPADCVSDSCNSVCLRNFFNYLLAKRKLFITASQNITVGQLVDSATAAGFTISISSCPVLSQNQNKLFYAITTDTLGVDYRAAIGDCIVEWTSSSGNPVAFNNLHFKKYVGNVLNYDSHNNTGSPTNQIIHTLTNGDNQPSASDVFPNNNVVVAAGNINKDWTDLTPLDTAMAMIFDPLGNNIWSKSLGIPNSVPFFTKVLSDTGFIVCGATRTNSSPLVHNIFMARFDRNYSIVWAKNYSFNKGSSPDSVDDLAPGDFLVLTDGSFVVSGVKPPIGGVANGFIFKTSSAGVLQWSHEYNRPDSSSDQMGALLQNGDTLITAGFGIDVGTPRSYNFFMSKILSANGSVLTNSTFDIDDDGIAVNWTRKLYRTPDLSGYYLTYFNSFDATPRPPADKQQTITGVVKLDNNLNPIKAMNFSYGNDTSHRKNLTSAIISHDGYMIITTRDILTGADSWIHKIDIENNSVVWTRHYQNAGTTGQLYTISELSDLSLFAAGEHVKSSGKGEIFTMHLDNEGNMPDGNCSLDTSGGNLILDTATITTFSPTTYPKTFWVTEAMKGAGVSNTQTLSLSSLTTTPVYTCGYFNDTTTLAYLRVISCHKCDTIIDYTCRSVVTDTAFNPYTSGVLGNWRVVKNYVYYNKRVETDPTSTTNVRTNGVINSFVPFWKFVNGILKPQYDTSRWVWNSTMTLFNRQGFEIENKDALGRYNAGLYGYNFTLPTAVIQNAQFRESEFEGFEDYNYNTAGCDTACEQNRQFDFTSFVASLTNAQSHTGQYSIRLINHDTLAVSSLVVTTAKDTVQGQFSVNTILDSCTSKKLLASVKITDSVLIPPFSPFAGKKMVISAWVKESQTCTTVNYANNKIHVSFSGGGSAIDFTPSGNIVEGWQRYEGIFTVPSAATGLTVALESTGSDTVYFDDLRIHPFNANMKSFVYNPVNLRLMAELDENNYATFYEYDDDGTLIRVKKETERGIMTIKETRSALIKQ
jgi:hypothetical protein